MAKCPKCNSALPPNAVVGSIAQCRICAHIFELPDPAAVDEPEPPEPQPPEPAPVPVAATAAATPAFSAAPERPFAEPPPRPEPETLGLPSTQPTQVVRTPRRYLGTPPSSVRLRTYDQGVEIILPWSRDQNFGGHLIGIILWVAPLIALANTDLEDISPIGGALGFLFFWFVFYSWLTNLVNATTVLIGNAGVEVSHGPLPNVHSTVRVAAGRLTRLHLKEVVHRGAKGRTYTKYQLESMGRGSKVLTKQWNRRESLAFVQDTIETAFDLPPG